MAKAETYDIAVIGGGPGGYVAALRASQLGAKVCLIEAQELGGTCLNVGCIPTKTLYKAARLLKEIKGGGAYGVVTEKTAVDAAKLMAYKSGVVRQLVQGVAHLLKKGNVTVIPGKAAFVDKNTLRIVAAGGEKLVSAKKIIIAAGSSNALPKIAGIDGDNVIDSTQALSLAKIPASLVVIGGGVIGCEFATIFNALGAKVTVIEMLPNLVSGVDIDCQAYLAKAMREQGIDLRLDCRVEAIGGAAGKKKVSFTTGGAGGEVIAETVLVAIGRKPNSDGLRLEAAGVTTNKGWVKVNKFMETSVAGIYAIGDITGEHLFAHAAYEEALTAAEGAVGQRREVNHRAVPKAIFTIPEIGSVGLTEAEARQQGYDVMAAKFPLQGNGKALIDGEAGGFVKVVSEKKYHEILGIHIVGPHATELTGEAALAINTEARLEDVVDTIHAHPTVAEAVKEAALLALGRQLHC